MQHHPEPARRHADLDQVLHAGAHRRAEAPAPGHRALARDPRTREVDLGHEVCDLRGGLPPRIRILVVGVRPVREEKERTRPALGQAAEIGEHIGAVLRRRRRPRGRQLRTEELVLGDQRVVAARRGDGGVEELVGARLDRRRVGGVRRRADAVVQVEVEVDGLRALGPQLRRDDELRRGCDDPRPREDRRPERHHPVGVVDPERLCLWQPAGKRQRRRRAATASDPRAQREERGRNDYDPPEGES